ncbi:MAG: S8 family serine peptidase [Chloroflexi bacterium]|nr:S8 family serine peptidase [Chloroflexota bacterium]
MARAYSSSRRKVARKTGLACAVILLIAVAATTQPAAAGDYAQSARSAQLDSRLAQLVEAFHERGIEGASAAASRLDIDLEGDAVRVIVEARPGRGEGATTSVRTLGATVEGSYQNLVQALVPLASLEPLARTGSVEFVRPPLRPVPMVTGEGVALINADGWQALGVSGAGVKVAILDLGFQGYGSLLGTELPAAVSVMSFRADADIGGGTPHGTAVAEIVHEVAPGAELYLVNFETEVELATASEWLTGQGVEAINASWGFFVSGPGDGTGPVNDVVSTSTAAGTLWSVAAANHAQKHWSGPFLDTDSDLFHEFQNSPFQDEGNQVAGAFFGLAFPGEVIGAELKWDDPFGAACRDYDLYLKRSDDVTGAPITVASSENVQNDGTGCVPGADPVESLIHTVTVVDVYHLVIQKSVASSDAFLDLYSFFHDIEYVVSSNSLGQPADNPDVLTVAAVNWCTPDTIEPFSSLGPTTDGRTKPDIAGPDGVSNATYPPLFACTGFSGTSAAAPHVTGAIALVRQLLPCYTPAQLQAYLEASVVDLGDPGKDNTFGSGRLLLGTPPLDTDGDGQGDACDPDIDGDGWTNVAEGFMATDPLLACGLGSGGKDGWPADTDSSRLITGSDIFFVTSRFFTSPPGPPYSPRAEIGSQNGIITGDDVFAVTSRFFTSC